MPNLISEIADVPPPASNIASIGYMEITEDSPDTRSAHALVAHLDGRYAKTDIERSWAWVREFATPPTARELKRFPGAVDMGRDSARGTEDGNDRRNDLREDNSGAAAKGVATAHSISSVSD